MLDFSNLDQYHENNRIEAKKALGGLPHSIWETYSAFANTLGGIILLGVEELPDKSLRTVDLLDPEWLLGEFWNILNDPQKVSANILTEDHIQIHEINGDHIIAITVPRAHRGDRPVYLDNDPIRGTYRRNGEGDYHCTPEEVQAMLRDAAVKTQDMKLLTDLSLDVLDKDTLSRYRKRMQKREPGSMWCILDDQELLYKLGAAGFDAESILHPTAAGLLMFGTEAAIRHEYPLYQLDYQQVQDSQVLDRLLSSSGDWSGNLLDFYLRVTQKIVHSSFAASHAERTQICTALCEALANSLLNADYYLPHGLVVILTPDSLSISNPGGFRIQLDDAIRGGTSDPRNELLTRMFHLIGIGQRSGSGLSNLYHLWNKQGWQQPVLAENFDPERTSLLLSLEWKEEASPLVTSSPRNTPITIAHRDAIISYLTFAVSASCSELAELLDRHPSRVRALLRGMIHDGILEASGNGIHRVYRLKA